MTYLIDDLNVLFVRLCSIEVLADIVGHIHSLFEGRGVTKSARLLVSLGSGARLRAADRLASGGFCFSRPGHVAQP